MRHGKANYKLGRLTQHRWALFRNLLVALFRHERITTTEAKAKAVRGAAEHMITLAKREDLHARRQVLSGRRPGDNAPMVILELVDRVETGKDRKDSADKKEKAPKAEGGAAAKGKRKKKEKAAAASA